MVSRTSLAVDDRCSTPDHPRHPRHGIPKTDFDALIVLHGPLQPHTQLGDTTHPTGFFRDGYCWGSDRDSGQHFIGGVVTKEFLEFSKSNGGYLFNGRWITTSIDNGTATETVPRDKSALNVG